MRAKIVLCVVAALLPAVISFAGDDPQPAPAAPAAYAIPWQSVNAGGAPATSTNYQLNGSAGQSATGFVASPNYQHGIGYWYGIPGGGACYCGTWGDVSNDSQVNPVDVVRMVNYVYKGQPGALTPPPGFDCPFPLGDVSCDGNVNPVDVVKYVNYVYKGQTGAFCPDPCGP